jgi:hypothetical protein
MDARQVITRMEQGDLPILASDYSFQSSFEDGTPIAHQVMQSLVSRGCVEMAAARQRGVRWSLLGAVE